MILLKFQFLTSLLEYKKFNFQRCFSAESEKIVSISIFALVTKKVKWGKHNKKGASGSGEWGKPNELKGKDA